MDQIPDLCERINVGGVPACVCVFVHFMYSCMSALHRLRFGVESARVSVCALHGCSKVADSLKALWILGLLLGCALKGHLQGEGWVQGVMHTQGKGDRDGGIREETFWACQTCPPATNKPNTPSDSIMWPHSVCLAAKLKMSLLDYLIYLVKRMRKHHSQYYSSFHSSRAWCFKTYTHGAWSCSSIQWKSIIRVCVLESSICVCVYANVQYPYGHMC